MPVAHRWQVSRQTPTRFGRPSSSITRAMSSIVRPIVLPAPAEFSITRRVGDRRLALTEHDLHRGDDLVQGGVEAPAEVAPEVEHDAVGRVRLRGEHRLSERLDALANRRRRRSRRG